MGKNKDYSRPAGNAGGKKIFLVLLALAVCAGAAALACGVDLPTGIFGARTAEVSASAVQGTAVTVDSAVLRRERGVGGEVIATLPRGAAVELLERSDASEDWVRVRTSDGRTGWCSAFSLSFGESNSSSPPDFQSSAAPSRAAVSSAPSSEEPVSSAASSEDAKPSMAVVPAQVTLEKASEPLSVSVSIASQRVTVFDAENLVVKQFVCSTGEKGSETPTGTFRIAERGESFYNDKLQEGGYFWTQFEGNYLFHSVPFGSDGKLEPEEAAKLGTPASHGCVRLAMDDAKWIYDHIPRGTSVTIS